MVHLNFSLELRRVFKIHLKTYKSKQNLPCKQHIYKALLFVVEKRICCKGGMFCFVLG